MFDIVASHGHSNRYFPDAEILAVCQDVVNELHLQNVKVQEQCLLRMVHDLFLGAEGFCSSQSY